MSKSDNPVRDRTLVLRVLVPSLEGRLREKMKDANTSASSRMPLTSNAADYLAKETLADLDGVTCEPSSAADTLWKFSCDGVSYPARLVNLPCPVELHKTHDHAMYYKCSDVAQLLVVYEDGMSMEEAEATQGYKSEHYPSYYHSGLTPPMKRVVERRFEKRDIKVIPPPRTEVTEIEQELRKMIDRVSDSSKSNKGKSKTPSLSVGTAKAIEEVEEELVDYEFWMDENGKKKNGIEFSSDDPLAIKYPDLWLDAGEIEAIKQKLEAEEEENKKKQKAVTDAKKKKSKKNSKKSSTSQRRKVNAARPPVTSKVPAIQQLGNDATEAIPTDLPIEDLDNFDMDDLNILDLEEGDELDLEGMDL